MIPLLDLAAMLLGGRIPDSTWSDRRLVRACLHGDEAAWAALVDKYKNLVFALAIESGADDDTSAELFQAVWLHVHAELPSLAKRGSIRRWLIDVTSRKCRQWQERAARERRRSGAAEAAVAPPRAIPVERLERDQLVREAIRRLSPRCRELVRLLFYEQPPRPCKDLAAGLGLSSAAFETLRDRCLASLQRQLESRRLA